MNLYIADLHFGHRSVLDFDPRPFSDVDEMDRILIELWNSRVTEQDEVYILGDFAFRSGNAYSWYLEQLKGRKHLIAGNHDFKLRKDPEAVSFFESIDSYLEIVDEKRRVILCHYPIAEWNGFHRGSWHVYGHIHSRKDAAYHFMKQYEKALNAAACINHYVPCSLEELERNNRFFREKPEEAGKEETKNAIEG